MKEHKSYAGTLKGISGIWCDHKPKGLKVEKENIFYTADEGKVFTKDGELFDTVFIKDESVKIEDYIEIKDPRPAEEPVVEEPIEAPQGE